MLKKFAITGLTILALFVTTTAYSQIYWASYNYGYQPMPNATAYAPGYIWEERTGTGYIVTKSDESASNVMDKSYYAKLPGYDPYYTYMQFSDTYVPTSEASDADAARAIIVSNEDVTRADSRDRNIYVVSYQPYVRPSEKEEEILYLQPMTTGSVENNGTFVAPHGYKYYNEKTSASEMKKNVPIRDFRTDFWQDKYYRDEFHNQESYNQTYGQYNYWNAGSWSSASEK